MNFPFVLSSNQNVNFAHKTSHNQQTAMKFADRIHLVFSHTTNKTVEILTLSVCSLLNIVLYYGVYFVIWEHTVASKWH